ncbi:MAG: hypothetical protein AAF889_00255 [Cyanobacteria bacterium P01_D01_bin.73]
MSQAIAPEPNDSEQLAPVADPWDAPEESEPVATWYLGIDIGESRIAAVLWCEETGESYPIDWSWQPADGAGWGQAITDQPSYPAAIYLTPNQRNLERWEGTARRSPTMPWTGFAAIQAARKQPRGLLLSQFKHALGRAVSCLLPQDSSLEPKIAWTDTQAIAFHWLVQGLTGLLRPLGISRSSISNTPKAQQPQFSCSVEGWSVEQFRGVMGQVQGVMVSQPVEASEAFRFNGREAVLRSQVADVPEQVMFLDEAVAAAIARFPEGTTAGTWLTIQTDVGRTQLAIVSLRDGEWSTATHQFAYGAGDLDCDAIAQLFCREPEKRRHFGLGDLPTPVPGQIDEALRQKWRYRLLDWGDGCSLLNLAGQLARATETMGLALGEYQWTLSPEEWRSQVLRPWLDCLNGELNHLFSRSGYGSTKITEIVTLGSLAQAEGVRDWLRRKVPGVEIVRGDRHLVARGLARGFSHLEGWQNPPSPYDSLFLLSELLQVAPDEPLSLDQWGDRLERRGINRRACWGQIQGFFEGHFPPGLLPDNSATSPIPASSRTHPGYLALQEKPLFVRHGDGSYQIYPEMALRWRRYLGPILARSQQGLTEPYPILKNHRATE